MSRPLATTTTQQGPIVSDFVDCQNNPGLSFGAPGAFDAGSVRDSKIWYARGLYWQLYTGAASPSTPYNPSIGIASSPDGCNWTKGGQIILPNAAVSQCSGAVFSPGAYYIASTDVLYVYPSCASTGEQWYCGPVYVAQMHARTRADWTRASSFVWDNGGIPILTASQSWEGTQGVYGADVYLVNGTFYMFYSSNTRGVLYQGGIASAPFPGGRGPNPTQIPSRHLQQISRNRLSRRPTPGILSCSRTTSASPFTESTWPNGMEIWSHRRPTGSSRRSLSFLTRRLGPGRNWQPVGSRVAGWPLAHVL